MFRLQLVSMLDRIRVERSEESDRLSANDTFRAAHRMSDAFDGIAEVTTRRSASSQPLCLVPSCASFAVPHS